MRPVMARRARCCGAMFVSMLALGGASGCGASVSAVTQPANARPVAVNGQPQRPGTCQFAPPSIRIPTGEWTATETTLSTNAADACAGERVVRPIDFRRHCAAGHCETVLFTVGYYGLLVANVRPAGNGRYIANYLPHTVPCPHPPGQSRGTNEAHKTLVLSSSGKKVLVGRGTTYQKGSCGRGIRPETSAFVIRWTNPNANPPPEGP